VLKGLQKSCEPGRSNSTKSIHQSLRKWGPCQKEKLWKAISTPQEETNILTLTRPLFLLHGEGIAMNMKAMASTWLNGCSSQWWVSLRLKCPPPLIVEPVNA
jgi:hypothetical protein